MRHPLSDSSKLDAADEGEDNDEGSQDWPTTDADGDESSTLWSPDTQEDTDP